MVSPEREYIGAFPTTKMYVPEVKAGIWLIRSESHSERIKKTSPGRVSAMLCSDLFRIFRVGMLKVMIKVLATVN